MWNHFGSIFVIFDTDIHGVNDILNFMIDLKKNINERFLDFNKLANIFSQRK